VATPNYWLDDDVMSDPMGACATAANSSGNTQTPPNYTGSGSSSTPPAPPPADY